MKRADQMKANFDFHLAQAKRDAEEYRQRFGDDLFRKDGDE